jgi:hypothetical protein
METFMNTNCVPAIDALFRIFEYATDPEIFMIDGERILFHHEAYNIAPCIFVSKLWNKIATKCLQHICVHCHLRSQYSLICYNCNRYPKFYKDTMVTYSTRKKLPDCACGIRPTENSRPVMSTVMRLCKVYHFEPVISPPKPTMRYIISSLNSRSIVNTVMRLRKVYHFKHVISPPKPLMDWWTAMFPHTIKLRPVHIISTHADHLIDTWMKTWPCKEKENILPLIGEFGRSDLLQTHRFQAWYPGTECVVHIALGGPSNEHKSDDGSDRGPGHDPNLPRYPRRKTRSAIDRRCRKCSDVIDVCNTLKVYVIAICLAVENDHKSTAQMILDLFEERFHQGVFLSYTTEFGGVDAHRYLETHAWIQKHRPKWERQKQLNEGVDATPKKKKRKRSHP